MKVKDLMKTRNLVSVAPDDELAVAAHIMRWAGVRHLPVVDARRVVGVITEGDLLRHRAEGERSLKDAVRTRMTAPAETVAPDEEVAAACALMVARRIGCLPVVDDGLLIGILTRSDVIGSQVAAYLVASGQSGPRVELAMHRRPVSVLPWAPLLEAVGVMIDHDVRHVPVTDEEGRLLGIIAEHDVRTAIGDPVEALHQELEELEEMKVSSVMTTDVITVSEDAPLFEVARRFITDRIGAIPVVDAAGRLCGIVSHADVIRALLAAAQEARPEETARDLGADASASAHA